MNLLTPAYRQNNIEFRIASAGAIGKFKINQAHTFIQVSRKEFDFDTSSREVVLLSYDKIFNWLQMVERMFLEEEKNVPSAVLIENIASSFEIVSFSIKQTCVDNPTIFGGYLTELLSVIHDYAVIDIQAAIKFRTQGISSGCAFTAVAETVNDYLQQVLLAMHEFNNNIRLRKEPFLCISGYSLLPKPPGFTSIIKRAEFFRSHLGDEAVFLIKNYTNEDLSYPVIMALWNLGVSAMTEAIETTT